jgi:hypothetical protein
MHSRLESSIEQACVKIAKENGCELLKIRGAKGWPDRILIPKMYFIEFKTEGEELNPLQREIFKRLKKMGATCYEVDNVRLFKRICTTDMEAAQIPGTGC